MHFTSEMYIKHHLFAPISFNNVNNFLRNNGVKCDPYYMRQSTLGHVEWKQPKNLRFRIPKDQKINRQCEFDKNEWNTLSQFLIDPILVCCIRSLRVRVNPLTSQSSLTLGLTKFDYRAKMSYSHYAAFSYTFE